MNHNTPSKSAYLTKTIRQYGKPYQSEQDTITYLLSNGIFAVNGRITHYRYVDIVAFGFICIETKYSTLNKKQRYHWRVEPTTHNRNLRGQIIILCAQTPCGIQRTIWNANDPIFYLPTNQLKRGIDYNPARSALTTTSIYGITLTPTLWHDHIDRFDIIHTYLQNICTTMLTPENYHHYAVKYRK